MDASPPRLPRGAPLWVVGLTFALVAIGFSHRPPAAPHLRTLGPPEFRGKTEADAPVRGWGDVLVGVYRRIIDDRVSAIAGGVTFFALLSIFPAAAALVSIYGLFTDPRALADQLDALSSILPSGALDVIGGQMHHIADQGRSTLGVAFLVSLGVALWSANAGMKALFDSLNVVYGEVEKRGLIRLNLQSLAFTLGGLLFILLVFAAIVAMPIALNFIGLGEVDHAVVAALRYGRWPLLLICLGLSLAVIYRFGPSRTVAKWRWITWGSTSASLLWLAASLLFSWYAANFGSYNKTYGTLGAAIGFMTWLWISSMVVLAGAELDAELENQDPSMPRKRRSRAAPPLA